MRNITKEDYLDEHDYLLDTLHAGANSLERVLSNCKRQLSPDHIDKLREIIRSVDDFISEVDQ